MKVTRFYTCDYCHHEFEGMERKDDDHIKHCPCCEHETAKLIEEKED